ncbi:MAG TPA: 16S rRNA (guanine(527)-N(7))-methyltransferase RsmG [Anaerolineae bacterium]|nr:16S rRNA (guanine(527)-N(7))-methyltransferase RsmG [Anaerolineae bacterium]HMR63762.1 16S rRNA (guanine(527)-N(7))-methyltransferase RsmG [Anaerolineae bacterium]
MSLSQVLQAGAAQFQISLNERQLAAFELFAQELVTWNEKFNLTRITEPAEIAVKHFLDSLSVLAAWPAGLASPAVIDVGSGAGFPGVPLKIVRPTMRLTLLESTGKKAKFLTHLVQVLGLRQTEVVTARAELAGRQPRHRAGYDLAVARAVAPMAVLAEYTLPLLKVGGRVIAQKGQSPIEETRTAEAAIRILGGKLTAILPIEVPGLDAARHLVVIDKIKSTPQLYPRRPGVPVKEPI